ncbi:hypothetical protein ACKKBG_A35785 [Auxenochlorella protothecoides x Auxenochlorella symbiontica]
MGRKGGGKAGFMKAQMRQKEEVSLPEQDTGPEEAHPATSAPGTTQKEESTSTTSAKASAFLVDDGPEESAGERPSVSCGGETRGKMLQRHKREAKSLKEQVKRLGKKGREEAAALQQALDAAHQQDLEAMARAEEESMSQGMESLALGPGAAPPGGEALKPTKAQRKRQQRAAAEAEREARIAAELADADDSLRVQEEEAMSSTLAPLGLAIHEIAPDGHCLYRALEHQLDLQDGSGAASFQELRRLAAEHMRTHANDFSPYIAEDDVTGPVEDGEVFEAYCKEVESTAAWGGHLELQALSQALGKPIKVWAAAAAPQLLGDEHPGPALQICYLHHAYGLGEHYNSLVPVVKEESEGAASVSGDE